jgi:hypothetical protein
MDQVYHGLFETELIRTYVPEAGTMSHKEAFALAVERDAQAAAALKESAETQLQLERAMTIVTAELDAAFLGREKKILAELGYL